jgi:hypothetical protein
MTNPSAEHHGRADDDTSNPDTDVSEVEREMREADMVNGEPNALQSSSGATPRAQQQPSDE